MGMGNSRKIDYSLGEENDKFMIREGRKRRDKEHPHLVVRWGWRDGGAGLSPADRCRRLFAARKKQIQNYHVRQSGSFERHDPKAPREREAGHSAMPVCVSKCFKKP